VMIHANQHILSCRVGIAWLAIVWLWVGAGCARVDVPARLQDAATAASAGKWSLALNLTGKCLAAEPTNVTAMTFHGLCLFELQRVDDALEILETAAATSNDFAPQYFYGWVLCEKGRYADALGPLRKAYALCRNYPVAEPDVLCLLARCCLEQNIFPEGVAHLQRLSRFRPFQDAPAVYNALGLMWLHRADYKKAREFLMEANGKDRGNGAVCLNLAVLYDHYLRDPGEAMRYYEYSLKANQTSNDSTRLAKIQRRLQQLRQERRDAAVEGNALRETARPADSRRSPPKGPTPTRR